MLAALDVDSLHACLNFCCLKTVYAIGCCSKYLHATSRAFLLNVRYVGDWCRPENVSIILRDMPNVTLPMLAYARGHGRRVDKATFRLLQDTHNTEALCHAGIDTMTACGLKYVLQLPSCRHNVKIDMSPRWKSYLNTKMKCRINELKLTILDFKSTRIIRWLNLSSHVALESLDLCCDVCDMNRVVSLLPQSLEKLLIRGRRHLQDDVGFITEILKRFINLVELRVVNCIIPSEYNCNFLIDVFRGDSFRIPKLVGMDPFPVDAYNAALDRGCFICVCSSNFSNPYTAVEYIQSMGRAIFCTECQ